MLKITCKQRSAKGKRNTRDLQVHASNANAAPAQAQKNLRRFSRPGQHIPRCEERKPPLQTPVSLDLAIGILQSADLRKPAAKLFLGRNDGCGDLFPGSIQTLNEAGAGSHAPVDFGQMVSV